MKALGQQIILECYDCNVDVLNDAQLVEKIMIEAAQEAEATVLKSAFHPFFPQGVSGVVVIAESHLTIHTWPEYGYAAIDVFTCGDEAYPERAVEYLKRKFEAGTSTTVEVKRGQIPHIQQSNASDKNEDVIMPLHAVG